RGAFQNLFQSV
nr:Chain B, decamer fragment of androgen receptor [synthetic construct]2Q7I_B Chain B, Androgen receptor [Homo sapiens]2Q7K_B Chain B, Androgen receptor [Homo sapiens]4OEY_B Chain B, co-regulator peptide [synthetic construct]4OH5_B Chain B, co-regulator peptide [synthetic construct]4OK1_B Chain B, co-regulator peptide [synthetic construct]